MNQQIKTSTGVIIILIIAVTVGVFTWKTMKIEKAIAPVEDQLASKNQVGNQQSQPKACTQEAKQCPDGSYVSRTGPNCEFADCLLGKPTSAEGQSTDNDKNIMTIDQLIASKLPKGTQVIVRGKPDSCKLVDGSLDYEGSGSGCYLNGEKATLNLENFDMLDYKDQPEIIVQGKIDYCGGKKIPIYICGLNDVVLYQNN
jgi:hypothetical protein